MNKEKFKFLKECENVLLEALHYYVDNFAIGIRSEIVFRSDELSSMELFLVNNKNNKSIQVIISEGVNAEKEQFYGIRFYIQKIDENGNKVSDFSIKDYCTEMNLNIELTWFFIGNINFHIKLREYLKSVLEILKSNQFESILFSDNWIDIKPDFSPYK